MDIYLGRFIIINAACSLIFLLIYEIMYSLNFDFKNDNNFTKKDLTFLFLLIFGPFGLLPVFFMLLACGDKSARKFDDLVKTNHSDMREEAIFNYIDVAGEFQKQMFKEAVIDSAMSDNNFKKRNAIDILSKMKNRPAVAALKLMAKDKEYEIRFMAINKLNAIEDEYMREFDWYKTAIKVCGAVPELVFQYAALLLKFCRLQLLYTDLSHLYFNKAASFFKALIDENYYREEALYGYSVCLRNIGNAALAAELLEKNSAILSGNAVDELAACYFELKKNDKLKNLIDRVKKNELKCGNKLKALIENSPASDDNDTQGDCGGEGINQNELYSVYKINEFLQLFKDCENLNFELYYARLKTVSNTSMYPMIFKDITRLSKFSKIIYLKLLKGQMEANNARNLKYFLYDKDPVLIFFAIDVLSSTELPLRNEIFTSLILHPLDEVKIVTIKFAGMKKLRGSVKMLLKLLKSSKTTAVIKKETVAALVKIGDSYADRGVIYSLEHGDNGLQIRALNEIKKLNLKRFIDNIIQLIDSGAPEVKTIALTAAASFGGDETYNKLERFLSDTAAPDIREAATVEFCRALRPEAIANAVYYYSISKKQDGKANAYETDYKNYFSYLAKSYVENHINLLTLKNNYADNDFIDIIFRFRYELALSIAESRKKDNIQFYEYCRRFYKSGENNG
jgi:HEAT repeat protein